MALVGEARLCEAKRATQSSVRCSDELGGTSRPSFTGKCANPPSIARLIANPGLALLIWFVFRRGNDRCSEGNCLLIGGIDIWNVNVDRVRPGLNIGWERPSFNNNNGVSHLQLNVKALGAELVSLQLLGIEYFSQEI